VARTKQDGSFFVKTRGQRMTNSQSGNALGITLGSADVADRLGSRLLSPKPKSGVNGCKPGSGKVLDEILGDLHVTSRFPCVQGSLEQRQFTILCPGRGDNESERVFCNAVFSRQRRSDRGGLKPSPFNQFGELVDVSGLLKTKLRLRPGHRDTKQTRISEDRMIDVVGNAISVKAKRESGNLDLDWGFVLLSCSS
jgi:hypothetical protein